jgi:hypothetical protein
MNAMSKIADTHGYLNPRLPAYPISGLAGASLKHEHLSAILAEDCLSGFFEVHAENYMGAGGATAPRPRMHSTRLSRLAARSLYVVRGGRSRSTSSISNFSRAR